jgi:hypothetical protein
MFVQLEHRLHHKSMQKRMIRMSPLAHLNGFLSRHAMI